jgi:hypothetical protein
MVIDDAVGNEVDDEANDEAIDEVDNCGVTAKNWLSTMTCPEMDCADEFVEELTEENSALVFSLLDLLGKKAVADIKKNIKVLKVWAKKDCVYQRKYAFFSVPQLQSIAKAVGVSHKLKAAELRDALVEHDKAVGGKVVAHPGCNGSNEYMASFQNNTTINKSLKMLILESFINSSLIKPVTKLNDKRELAGGHRNEEPFIKSFYRYYTNKCGNREHGFCIETIHRPGLVRHKELKYIKSSADGLMVVRNFNNNQLELIPIEVKSQMTQGTAGQSQQAMQAFVGDERYSGGASLFLEVDVTELQTVLYDKSGRHKHEILQILHHAYTYQSRRVLMLIGNDKSLMYAILINVPALIWNAFGKVVQFAYNQGINRFYRAKIDNGLFENVKKVIEEGSKLQKRNLDIGAFNLHYLQWRTLNIESNQFNSF